MRRSAVTVADLARALPATPRNRLHRHDFNRPTLIVARELLGKFIVHRVGRREIAGMITETEAYKGPRDRAAHTHGGRRTMRVEPLYGDGGTVYVYLVYGIHWMLNFSSAGREQPEGVLIRGVNAETPSGLQRFGGPGLVSKYLQIDKTLDGIDAAQSRVFWVEDRGVRIPSSRIRKGPRIGVEYAGEYWAARAWRFCIDQ